MVAVAGREQTKVVELPSGGTWTLNTAPKYREVRVLAGQEDERAILAALTVGWSFPEPVTAESIDERDFLDVATVLDVVETDVLPLFSGLNKQKSSG